MTENYHIGTYWGVREESAEECAERALLFFRELKRIDPSFDDWYRAGRKRDRALPGIPVDTSDRARLEETLRNGRNRTDIGKKTIEELGFHLSVWNRESERISIWIQCGVYTPSISNVCGIDLPSEGASSERLISASVLAKVFACMVTAWDPDHGRATTSETQLAVPNPNRRNATVGWLTYLSHRQGTVPPLPAPVRIERLGDKGTLITLTPERFTASNPEHLALLVRVRELLDRAGVLKGLQAR